jgi:hypothetical protein
MSNKFDNMTKEEIYALGIKQGLCIGLETFETMGVFTSEMMEIVLNKVMTVNENFSDIKELYEKYKNQK